MHYISSGTACRILGSLLLQTTLFTLLIASALFVIECQPASAQTYHYSTLYSFHGGTDGANPDGALLVDASGNFYSTALYGGDLNCVNFGIVGCGVVFKLSNSDKETALHSFDGMNGQYPNVGLIADKSGNGYGTAGEGGTDGFGVVFEIDRTGTSKVLYNFTGGADGGAPNSFLTLDASGNLYGTTEAGGDLSCTSPIGFVGCGVVFKLDKQGREKVLYAFTGGADGSSPIAGLTGDAAGNIYGTTIYGGDLNCAINPTVGCGVVFKIDRAGHQSVLHSFTGPDGALPGAAVYIDKSGNLYSTTLYGGSGSGQAGTVFKLDSTGKETVLYNFIGGPDGGSPDGGLITDPAGNFYSTASQGGSSGFGVVFKLAKTQETVLYNFTGGADGAMPEASLIRDKAGALYGTATYGGDPSCVYSFITGCGVVFKLAP
jgi:uncharacterized repeat protein (TIGR03803 family)